MRLWKHDREEVPAENRVNTKWKKPDQQKGLERNAVYGTGGTSVPDVDSYIYLVSYHNLKRAETWKRDGNTGRDVEDYCETFSNVTWPVCVVENTDQL